MRTFQLTPLMAASLALAACSSENRTAGGVTPNEARALEDAAQMIEDQRVPPAAVPSTAASGATPAKAPTKPAG